MQINHPHLDSEQLFEQWRNGDHHAYERLFYHLYPILCHYAVFFGLEGHESEEVVQDCFFKLWQRRAHLDQIQLVRPYLYASVKHASLNHQKMNARKQRREHRYYELQPESDGAPDYKLMEAEVLAELRQAIRNLPEQCGKVVWLAYVEGLSGKEIAERLGVTVSTVNNQKSRGVKLLRDRLRYHTPQGMVGMLIAGAIAALQT